MASTSREKLRRDVRTAVHRSCWRRLEGDEATAETVLACEVPAALSAAGEDAASESEIRAWIEEDQADFDRAVLISELVARKLGHWSAAVSVRPTPSAPAPAPARRAEPAGAPQIADLLDGMLEQDRRRVAS